MSTPADDDSGSTRRIDTDTKAVVGRTRISGIWVSAIIATLLLVLLLIFIVQNMESVTVRFLGMSWGVPLGVAMLFSALAGALLVALPGGARVLQLRRRIRRGSARH
ncbi:putative integral membrane protein [Saccharomonospora amisosensis]|uniref:Putative integral membrane protein n=1 Tax=Saccharomonospora amisosensis TaxID=1128677 RepID=A0A7X5UQK3_9PSEU|nr:lipopolysaccharide assembly protein LapA domain-containing protein [Saccharomonospora amisosensis]NIJ12396.1 putative integral membrane protein [Saccharomonospora amisosensis]